MKKFIISLTSALDCRQHIQSEFDKHNVDYEFFNTLTLNVAAPYT